MEPFIGIIYPFGTTYDSSGDPVDGLVAPVETVEDPYKNFNFRVTWDSTPEVQEDAFVGDSLVFDLG